jgi:5-hydroxyisourate hydrolase-like protein (transthyretin family)
MTRLPFVTVLGFAAVSAAVAAAQQMPPPPPPPPAPITTLPAGAPTAPRGSAAISGVVLDRSTGAPVSGATVTISQRGNAQGFAAERHMTDARGRFVVRNLPPATTYMVMAGKPGFFDVYFGPVDANFNNAQPIVLAEGQWVSDIEVRMTRLGVITGRIVDEAGEAVVGAYVRALTDIPVAGHQRVAVSDIARTDDRGEYRISGLRAGSYYVSVPSVQHAIPRELPPSPPGTPPRATSPTTVQMDGDVRLAVGGFVTPPPREGTPLSYPPVFYPDARSIADATPIRVEPGRTETADIRLRPVPTWRVSGRVEADGGSAAGFMLRLVPAGMEDLGLGSEAATATVGSDGRFAFVNVPAGRYTIEGRRSVMEYRYSGGITNTMTPYPVSPAFSMQSAGAGTITGAPPGTMYSFVTAGGGMDLVGRLPVDVAGRDVADVVLPLRRPVKLTGRILRESDPAGPPPPQTPNLRTPVQMHPADGRASLGIVMGFSEEDGRFEVSGLLPGSYVLRPGGIVRSITWAGKDVTDQPFDASTGQDFSDVVVTLAGAPTTVAGTVRRTSAGSTTVVVFPANRDLWTNYGFASPRLVSGTAAATGSYQVQVPAGDYYVAAIDARFQSSWQTPAFLSRLVAFASRVPLEWGEKKTVDLTLAEVP